MIRIAITAAAFEALKVIRRRHRSTLLQPAEAIRLFGDKAQEEAGGAPWEDVLAREANAAGLNGAPSDIRGGA
jgi:hypothetical protein